MPTYTIEPANPARAAELAAERRALAPRMVSRVFSYDFTRGVETDFEHGEELCDALWGKNIGAHFESCPAGYPAEGGAEITRTDLAGALAFIEEMKAETLARHQAAKAPMYAAIDAAKASAVRKAVA